MVNGNTWPFQTVEKRRYRFRFLNGCQSRFLILDFSNIPGVEVWQIGNEGGFLAAPVNITASGSRLLMGLAERADVIVDFTNVPVGNYVLGNVGPDEPFGGGDCRASISPKADPDSTGEIMQFSVVPAVAPDPTTPPAFLKLPALVPLPAAATTRPLALLEMMSTSVWDGPAAAMLGTVGSHDRHGGAQDVGTTASPKTQPWARPKSGSSTTSPPTLTRCTSMKWCSRLLTGSPSPSPRRGAKSRISQLSGPRPAAGANWETGFKDTVIAYPGEVTRIRAQFTNAGQFAWHCHIVEHEDNEMMRPYRIGPAQPGQPGIAVTPDVVRQARWLSQRAPRRASPRGLLLEASSTQSMALAAAAPCRLAKPCADRAVRPLWRFPRQTAKLSPAGAARRRPTIAHSRRPPCQCHPDPDHLGGG